LKQKYATAANNYQKEINAVSLSLSKLDGELEHQLATVKSLLGKLDPLRATLKDIQKLNHECVEANIEDNEHTIYSLEDLEFELGILQQSLTKTSGFIENQIVARSVSNITPQQLESYTETFRHFDKENTNSLSREQFKAALRAEGGSYPDQEIEKLFRNTDHIKFQQFIDFMRAKEEDKATPDQILVSFNQLAGDKDFITERDMVMG
jgi:Ca2+-binding EF-hand superfamily protein